VNDATTTGRLIVDEPADGAWNMAVDAAILKCHLPGDPPTLRFYRWSSPTLSLGYFQSIADRNSHRESLPLDVVRRTTGGGAIVHDCELTYSLVTSQSVGAHGAVPYLYHIVHTAIIKAFAKLNVVAMRHGDATMDPHEEPFLCFQRRTSEDLVLSGYKIVGSAQRRGAGAVLQHGSLLIAASPSAPQLPGVLNLIGGLPSESGGSSRTVAESTTQSLIHSLQMTLAETVASQLEQELRIVWTPSSMSTREHAEAEKAKKERFSAESWVMKR
jgi:lipoyl(octanoyl) transferase